MSKRSQSQSKKRKAAEPMVLSPNIQTRSQKVKLNNSKRDPETPIKINLSEQFSKITIDSGQKGIRKQTRSVSKAQTPKSGKKTRPKVSIKEREDSEDRENDNTSFSSNQSTAPRVTRSSTRQRKESLSQNDDDDDYDIRVYNHKFQTTGKISSRSKSLLESGSKSKASKTKSNKKENNLKLEDGYSTPLREINKSPPQSTSSKASTNKKSNLKGTKKSNKLKQIEETLSGESSPEKNQSADTNDEDAFDKTNRKLIAEIEGTGKLETKSKTKPKPKAPKEVIKTQPKNKLEEVLEKFDRAILNLQEYTLPNEIPCRESEKQTIKDLITEGLQNEGFTHCLYISGVPGIGKTVSVLEVIKQLKNEYEDKELDFNFIHVNGLGLPNPENAYQTILQGIVDIKDTTNSSACVILNNLFQKGTLPKAFKQYKDNLDTRIRLILLDELDYLITKDQNLLYNLFDWPHYKHSKLIIIGIANTMNLPEQLLPKITSRMGNRRLVYKPYTSQQIEKILLSRIEKMDIIRPEAITFLSKKIATFSSDIRRTLHVCRESLKLCREEFIVKYNNDPNEIEEKGLLKLDHVRKSYDQIYSSPYHKCISMLVENGRLLLLAICLEMKTKGEGFASLVEVQDRLKGMMNNLGRKPIHHLEIKQIFNQLISLGLVIGKQKALLKKETPTSSRPINIMDTQISLKISLDDITNALKDDALITKYIDLL